MQVVILAGGAGTRLAALMGELPKALVDIAGKPLIHRQLDLVARHRFTKALLLIKHGASYIRSSCGNGSAWGMAIEYREEAEARGTAGALREAYERLDDQFVVLYGDIVLNVDLERMWSAHVAREADATLFVHPNDHPYDSDIVETDLSDRIVALHPYPHPQERDLPNLVNAGLYVVEKRCLDSIPKVDGILDFAKQLVPILLHDGKHLSAYRSREYVKDAGTTDRLSIVVADMASGRVGEGSLETPAPAVFLDRDGTLIDDPGYIANPEQIRPFPGVGQALRRLNRSRYLAVLASNQPVVARGEVDERGLKLIHNRLEQLLGRDHAYLDAIYYCPHHPDRGFPGERPEYKIACNCRKPATGMIERAVAEMNIGPINSWMIGDTSVDVETAARANLRSVVLGTGHGGRDGRYPRRPDFEFPTLTEAVDFILDVWPKIDQQAADVASKLRPGDLVLIAGLARSGKSSFASALAWKIRQINTATPKVISLDGWIKPLDERRSSDTVVDRYRLETMQRAISRALVQGGALAIPVYDRRRRGPDQAYSLNLQPSDIVILEGVVALLLALQMGRRVVRIYISRDEDLRHSSMAADYRSRQFTDEEFAKLYAERQLDEVPFIVGTRATADIVVESR